MGKDYFVDERRLKTVLQEKGLSVVKLSRELGYSDSYISGIVTRGKALPPAVVIYLKKVYSIQYEDYRPVSQGETKNPASEPLNEEMIIKLVAKSLSTFAVKDELGRAVRFTLLEEHTQDMLKKIVKEACAEALHEAFDK